MSTTYKYQEAFSTELAQAWLDGKHEHVRTIIRNLSNKAQAAYIAAAVTGELASRPHGGPVDSLAFIAFIHPNNR